MRSLQSTATESTTNRFPEYESGESSESNTDGGTDSDTDLRRTSLRLRDSPRRSLAHRLFSQEPRAADDDRCITGQQALIYLLVVLFDCGARFAA
eukprot:SAG31_NODE_827_length_11749_cov_14.363090_14_plen_95_part_00